MNQITVDHFIIDQQQKHKGSSGEFSELLSDIIYASKIVGSKVRKAGLIDILGKTGKKNASGEKVKKLDEYAHDVFVDVFSKGGKFAAFASEESEDVVLSPSQGGKYIVHIDPLDGSSNIDVNVSVGTIFSIYKRLREGGKPTEDEILQKGRNQICAGYVLYGSGTILVFSTGNGVHAFTYNSEVGEFLLSHENIKIPEKCKYFSVNETYLGKWSEDMQRYIAKMKKQGRIARHVGSLIADFHRNLLKGGIHLSPASTDRPVGKLRLMYETNPLAMLVEQAGGRASDGKKDILDIQPTGIHQSTPLFIGNKKQVSEIEKLVG